MTATFKRNQVEEALWRALGRGSTPQSSVFAACIKRLLDLDRKEDVAQFPGYAFLDALPGGKGIEGAYTGFDAFCLGIGIDLLDAGFTQRDIVFLLRHIRADLKRQYDQILQMKPVFGQYVAAMDRPGCPVIVVDGVEMADFRIYMVVGRVDLSDLLKASANTTPMIYTPMFIRGATALAEGFNTRTWEERKAMVVEIAEFASRLEWELSQALAKRRGRPG